LGRRRDRLRAAWQIGQPANFGLIPLVNKGLVDLGRATWFVEGAFPTFYSEHKVAFNVVLHTGVGSNIWTGPGAGQA